jgi:hypothetical protein
MVRKRLMGAMVLLFLIGLIVLTTQWASAAPSLPITKPPVQEVFHPWTGPTNDSNAAQGQWFQRVSDETLEVRPYEFHDNVLNNDPMLNYGGGTASYLAIYGKVNSITRAAGTSYVTAFSIRARITNDTPATTPWYRGEDSHGEYTTMAPIYPSDKNDPINNPVVDTTGQYVGTLYDTKLTIEFAVGRNSQGGLKLPATWTDPYTQGQYGPNSNPNYVVAENPDQMAWYCWTPNNPEGKQPYGDFYVPTYDFGDIAPGQTVERILSFTVSDPNGIEPADPRYLLLDQSYGAPEGEGDIFLNRTTDLKIGDWIDNIAADTGVAYPLDPFKAGNVSVFHGVPEPSTFVLLAVGVIGLLGCLWRRRSG